MKRLCADSIRLKVLFRLCSWFVLIVSLNIYFGVLKEGHQTADTSPSRPRDINTIVFVVGAAESRRILDLCRCGHGPGTQTPHAASPGYEMLTDL